MLIHRLTDSVFGRIIDLCVGSREEMNAHLATLSKRQRVGRDCLGLTLHITLPSSVNPNVKSRRYFIWLAHFEKTPKMTATLVHECFHCMSYIMEDLGVFEEDGGAEARAYYLDSLVLQCLTALETT